MIPLHQLLGLARRARGSAGLRLVAALYVDVEKGPYAKLPGVDVWGEERDARGYNEDHPVVAHPPCATWGKWKWRATGGAREHSCGVYAVRQVRARGGVLEHPSGSGLWAPTSEGGMGLPRPGEPPDQYDGWTLEVDQVRWGHLAQKRTWLYIVGLDPRDIGPLPPPRTPSKIIAPARGRAEEAVGRHLPKSQRHLTPPAFAKWLVELARRTRAPS